MAESDSLVLHGIRFGTARRLPDPDPLISKPVWLVEVTLPTGASGDVIVHHPKPSIEYHDIENLVVHWPDKTFRRKAMNRQKSGRIIVDAGIRIMASLDAFKRDERLGRR